MSVWENYIGDERENQEMFVRWVEFAKPITVNLAIDPFVGTLSKRDFVNLN